jgi:hypothetical protein
MIHQEQIDDAQQLPAEAAGADPGLFPGDIVLVIGSGQSRLAMIASSTPFDDLPKRRRSRNEARIAAYGTRAPLECEERHLEPSYGVVFFDTGHHASWFIAERFKLVKRGDLWESYHA